MQVDRPSADDRELSAWMAAHPDASLWQSSAWAKLQRANGRDVHAYAGREGGRIVAAALAFVDRTAGGYATWDLPRGPLLEPGLPPAEAAAFLDAIAADALADKAISLFFSPVRELAPAGSRLSGRHEQPEATVLLDLTLADEALMAQMKPKGRYNIRLAQRHGVTVEQSRHIPAFAALAHETAARDGFTAPSERHYERFLDALEGSFLLLAFPPLEHGNVPQKPVAGLLGVVAGETGIYYYGASSHAHRALMAPYLIQWEAMKFCRTRGCRRYDLLGISPPGAGADHPWAGVTDFKTKFGGSIATYPPERERVLRPAARLALRAKRRLLG